MHFGQFNLMGYRTPGTDPAALYESAIAQAKAADANGFEISWFAEHHFSNYCVCPSPLMMVARLAGETKRIKLGTGVVVAPLYNPVRLISEIGMVDAITGGRLVLGVGSGYQPYEFERFGEDLADAPGKLIEMMDMLELAVAKETFSHDGRYYKVPETHIATRPRRGMPDVWLAGDNADLHKLAARKGYTVMVTPRHFSADLLAAARARFEATYKAVGADPRELKFAALRHVCVTDSTAEAADFLDNVRHQIRLSQSLRLESQEIRGGMLAEKTYPNEAPIEQMASHMLIGDPHTIAERLVAEIRRASPCHYLLHFQAGASSLATALRSIERFAGEVRPLVEKAVGPIERIGMSSAAE
jgi:alkanesulfonate monooxygenase SsuD/methylene tetrahydromethanopterin reductase-like flavin-dependent oxidoreductase (luciferase family)